MKNVLIFTAHPDDLEIGMGGTVPYLIQKGFDVILFIGYQHHDIARTKEAKDAAQFLKIKKVNFLNFSSDKREIVKEMDRCIEIFKPHSVFTQWIGDSHQEHKTIAECVLSAARKNNFNVYMFEEVILGGLTEGVFRPQMFIDISEYMDKKIEAIKIHKSRFKDGDDAWADGLVGRAAYRGYQCNVKYAEVFQVVKQIGLC